MRIALPVVLSVLLVCACGSESERDNGPETTTDAGTGGPDAGTTSDAGTTPDGGTDAGTRPTCTALSSYSGPVGGTARLMNSGKQAEVLGFYGDLLGGDRIVVLMFANFGALGYHTGTYDLADRTKVLVDIYTDSPSTTFTADYKTTSGSLNVTSVSGKFSGVITNATLISSTEPGCTVTVPTMTFEGFIE